MTDPLIPDIGYIIYVSDGSLVKNLWYISGTKNH